MTASPSAITLAPALFISHGAPTFALEPGLLGARLRQIGETLTGVRSLLVVSPHWQTDALTVMSTPHPQTIHDFGGFAPALYQLQYPAAGDPQTADTTLKLLENAGWPATLDTKRGLDHGAWVPMMHLRPQADLPVFQLSLPWSFDAPQSLALGRALAPLREQGLAIVGSGSMTHNLSEFRGPRTAVEPYVDEFTGWVQACIRRRDLDALTHYRALAPHALRAHPTEEHFLPLLVAMGASHGNDSLEVFDGDTRYGMLSMASFAWGLAS
jgi:4,5-DOPA dioxygenase extradiol